MTVPDDMRIMGVAGTLRRVTRMASPLDRYVKQRRIAWQQHAVAYELENMAGVVLSSPQEAHLDYVRDHGALFCGTID